MADEGVMSQPGSADVARWMASAGRHQHQSILFWVWEVLTEDDLRRAPGTYMYSGGWGVCVSFLC